MSFRVQFNGLGGATILGRLTMDDGSGSASPVASEGNLVVAADLASIRIQVFDITGGAETQTYSATPSASSVIQTTLQTSGIWGKILDGRGGNFKARIPSTAFPAGCLAARVEVKAVANADSTAIGWGKWEGIVEQPHGT